MEKISREDTLTFKKLNHKAVVVLAVEDNQQDQEHNLTNAA
jgi:hypothetical protein